MPSAAAFLTELHRFIGDPYVYGAAGPNAFDCSGLVYYALQKIGVKNPPRTAGEQYAWTQHITESQLQPGDLIFEQWPGDTDNPGHVVIWLGNGKIEQAPQTGQLVQTDSFSPSQVTQAGGQVVGYGRIPGLVYTGAAGDGEAGGGPATGATSAQLTSFLTSSSGGVLGDAGALLHGSAVVLDRVFGLFAPGQGWRAVFWAAAGIMFFMSYRAFGGGAVLGR